jgi:HAE1 family hydrophobic/amphiphilic exporter-1
MIEATLEAAKLRLRPILMTSLAFGFGVMPMAFARGAGAGAQKAIGTAVLGGVVTSTFLVTLFAPLFYVLIFRLFKGKETRQPLELRMESSTSARNRTLPGDRE